MHYVGISTWFIPYYARAIHKHWHTRILKPFEDSLPTGLKVDIAVNTRVYKFVHPTDSRGRYAEPLSFGLYRNVYWNRGDKMTTQVTCPVTSAPATAGEAEVTSKCIVIMALPKSQVSKVSCCKAVCVIMYCI